MPITTIETFDAVDIKNASVLFKGTSVTEPFGCVGSLDAETEMKTMKKTCGGRTLKQKAKPIQMNVTINAHLQVKVLREIFGITNKNLKDGVFSYGTDSIGKDFTFVAEEVDDFEAVSRYIAFPNCSSATGFIKSLKSGEEEVAETELTITCLADAFNQFYYEAFQSDLSAEDKKMWMTAFDPAKVQKSAEKPSGK
ncbi:phage tail protein [Bacillus albus]|uniref:phage tail protein n=1 Tax=Bacillus albus TaxID=2026189 RepID=UPI001020A695|nr:phage tail protein [Bacillus albus]